MINTLCEKYGLTTKEVIDCISFSYLGLFVIFYIFYQNILLSLLSGFLLPICMKYYAAERRAKRKEFMALQFRDLLYSLSASFAAGRHMSDGLREAESNLKLVYDGNTPMLREISGILSKLDESRASEEEVLKDFAQRSAVSDIQGFIDTYLICRMTGGDINSVISKASAMLIEKIGIEKEIKTLTAQKCFEGRIISAMPVIVILFLNIASPGYIEILYSSFIGRVIMTVALAGIAYSYFLIMKLTKIEV